MVQKPAMDGELYLNIYQWLVVEVETSIYLYIQIIKWLETFTILDWEGPSQQFLFWTKLGARMCTATRMATQRKEARSTWVQSKAGGS